MDEHKITYLNTAEDTDKKPGDLVRNTLHKYDNYGGDSGNMDKYVTHQELNTVIAKINGRFDITDEKIDNLSDKFPIVVENKLLNEREYQRQLQKENRRFFWGTIIIGGISALTGIISIILSLM
ncbi:hypothetical protein [uncultured Limosilactobacillus sp.]|uniref:hypothetical protein n=1 Tax=uncultured Limosilactobacillus sp. TaxID=2837629 RepID=UPI0025953231|nr:hypothetical protein [uncultured Limosilactobacillus sp.]